jgi:hypothetical protein
MHMQQWRLRLSRFIGPCLAIQGDAGSYDRFADRERRSKFQVTLITNNPAYPLFFATLKEFLVDNKS